MTATPDEPTKHDTRDEERASTRAENLLPEEERAGSDDRDAQAEAILEESDERVEDPEEARRDSSQTPGG